MPVKTRGSDNNRAQIGVRRRSAGFPIACAARRLL